MRVEGTFEAQEWAILERIAHDAPLEAVLRDLVELIEVRDSEAMCSILLLDAEGRHVRSGPAPRLPPEYMRLLDGLEIGPAKGSCGAAAYLGQRVVVEDIASHPYWEDYKALALPFGLAACWSSPILSPEGRVLGTFAIYYGTPRGPSAEEIAWVDAVTHLASIAIVRHRTQQALRDGEERLRAVIENTPDVAIQWYDLNARILFRNQASERILGLSEEAVGKTLFEVGFWQEDEERRFVEMIQIAATGQRIEPIHFQFRRPDGSDGYLLSTVFMIPHSELGSCFVCMDVELTEQRRLENQLQRTLRAAGLGTLAGGIAHDFNNILGAISGNAQLGLQEPGEVSRSLGEIVTACARGKSLVGRILSFSNERVPALEALDLSPILVEVASLLQATLPANVTLSTEVPEAQQIAFAESTQVHQALMNLITNAKHALAPGGGTIKVSVVGEDVQGKAAATLELPEGEYRVVRVTDDGRGMDDTTLERVFDPFFTTKAMGEGTGLGLSVVQGVMKSHRGAVRVTSRVGRGTTFELYFRTEPPSVAAPASTEPPSPASVRILWVDDDACVPLLAERVLTRRGCQVTAFADPLLALKEFRERPHDFDLVITDASMPGLSGPGLIAAVRALRAELAAVMVSGYFRAEDVEAVERLGNVRVVPKPSTVEGYVALLSPPPPKI